MRIKNLTPFLHAAKVTSRRPPRPEMTLIVRGLFHLAPGRPVEPVGRSIVDQGRLSGDVCAEDDEERAGELLHASDFADWKPRAEVLVRASCHTPGGKPMAECPVRVSVGAWSKLLRVVGLRAWSDGGSGAVMSRTAPFTSMPIRYTHALGGPGHAPNPAGVGIVSDMLPNVEYPGAPIRSRGDRSPPAGFGPINPAWPERRGKVGREYGRSYRKLRAPYYAEDFDWTYFNAAPADQQLPEYLRGDEDIVFENLHSAAPRLSARLPGLRVRAFVHDRAGRFREVPMVLDTLHADLEDERLALTYRGLVEVEEDDLADVLSVLFASERLDEARQPEEGYREQLLAFERDPIGLDARVPPEVRAFMEQSRAQGEGKGPPVDALVTLLRAQPGGLSDADEAHLRKGLTELPGKVPANANGPGAPPPTAIPGAPGVMPVVPLADVLRTLRVEVAQLKSLAAGSPLTRQAIEALEAVMADPRLAALDPAIAADSGPQEEPGPGRNLAGRDLRGRDLAGLDLTGANLEGANLSGAKLCDAKLVGANLARAILHEADLTGADLTGADLSQANLTRAKLARATLRRAKLRQTAMSEADLAGATLDEVRADQALLRKANLAGASARGARLERTFFDEARLEGADFSGASLFRCHLRRADARRLDLSRATLDRSSFSDADLTGAVLRGARGLQTSWMGATLRGADLSRATLPRAIFNGACVDGARLFGADLREGRFYRASFVGSDLRRANLFGADLRKAQLEKAILRGASLYDAKLMGADLSGCDLDGANLVRATLEAR